MSTVFNIDREHPEYLAKRAMWRTYRDLYAGGEQFKAHACEYLVRRQKEPLDVYSERLSRVFYENYLGSIIDWFAATLFRREPIMSYQGSNEAAREFFGRFIEDCDLRGTSLTDFIRRVLIEALVTGTGYVLVDFPRSTTPVANRADEEAVGRARAYLVDCRAEELINWSYDSNGNLDWVVIRTSHMRQDRDGDATWIREKRWVYYDKEDFQIYRKADRGDEMGKPELVDEGRHALARLGRVPIFELKLSEGMWLSNKAAMLQLEHFNKSNALAWALTMGLFATPVVYSDREWNQIVGESYYIQLGPDDKFGWTEPQGNVYQIASENLTRLKDEIYRVCYLLTQAGGTLSGGTAQSGLSKQRDFTITQEVLRGYGDTVKDLVKRVLCAVEAAREDGMTVDISGLDEFDIGDFSDELEDATKLLSLGVGSKTLRKQVLKKLSLKYLCDVNQEVKDQIVREIEAWCEQPLN